jgi:hypothetical protein
LPEQFTPSVKIPVVTQADALAIIQGLVKEDTIIHAVKSPSPDATVWVDEVFHLDFPSHILGIDLQAIAHRKVAVNHQTVVKKAGVEGHVEVSTVAIG